MAGGAYPVYRPGANTEGWAGNVRIGGKPPAAPAAPWTPPPLPTGSYNPQRDIETQESQRGLGQLEGELGTARSRDTADYFTQAGEIGRRGEQEQQDYNRAKELLQQSFQRLGVKQEEGANKLGVLSGGALLQSAQKRAANQAQQQETADTNFNRQKEANDLALAKLTRELGPPDTANPLGGRTFQDLLTKLTNAQANNTFFGTSEQRLAGQEAAERGYVPPTAPTAPAPRSAIAAPRLRSQSAQPTTGGQRQRPWRGNVRVGGRF